MGVRNWKEKLSPKDSRALILRPNQGRRKKVYIYISPGNVQNRY